MKRKEGNKISCTKNAWVILLYVLLSTPVFGQFTGGGGKKTAPPLNASNKSTKETLRPSFYLNFMVTSAIGKLGTPIVGGQDFILNGYGSMNNGLGSSLGILFYFSELNFGRDDMKLGMDFGANFAWVNSSIDQPDGYSAFGPFYEGMTFYSIKTGLLFSYNPTGKLIFDARASLIPTLMDYDLVLWNDPILDTGLGFDYFQYMNIYSDSPFFKMRYGIGFAVRYRPFMFGLDWSWSKVTNEFNLYVPEGDGTGNSVYIPFESEIGTGRFDIVFGFSF